MNLEINGEVKTITANEISIQDMLKNQLKIIPRGIAIAIDEQIIPQNQWDNYIITEDQKVLIITATQGG